MREKCKKSVRRTFPTFEKRRSAPSTGGVIRPGGELDEALKTGAFWGDLTKEERAMWEESFKLSELHEATLRCYFDLKGTAINEHRAVKHYAAQASGGSGQTVRVVSVVAVWVRRSMRWLLCAEWVVLLVLREPARFYR